MSERAQLKRARRVVIKVGSRTLASDPGVYARIAAAVAAARREERSVVLVSSGAIALGVRRLGWKTRPREMARLQAAAAAGQTALMLLYEQAFRAERLEVAQVLLTHADLADRVRGNNARAAIQALLEAGAVPILNENDSVSVEEIKFGDNDQLAALVAPLVDADLVVLLSDVDGLLGERGARIGIVRDVTREALPLVRPQARGGDPGGTVGTGGMASKLEAARRATNLGSPRGRRRCAAAGRHRVDPRGRGRGDAVPRPGDPTVGEEELDRFHAAPARHARPRRRGGARGAGAREEHPPGRCRRHPRRLSRGRRRPDRGA